MQQVTVEYLNEELTLEETQKQRLDSLVEMSKANMQVTTIKEQRRNYQERIDGMIPKNDELDNKIAEVKLNIAREQNENFDTLTEDEQREIIFKIGEPIKNQRNAFEEKLDAMSDEEIDALFVDANGEEITINIPLQEDSELSEIRRDMLIFLNNTSVAMVGLDNALVELDAAMAEHEDNVKEIYKETNGDIAKYIKDTLNQQLAASDNELDRVRIQRTIKAFDDALTLDPIYEVYKSLNAVNVINDIKRRGDQVTERFVKNTKAAGIVVDFSRMRNIEHTYLPEKYHGYGNLFVFLLVRMYSYKKDINRFDGIFLTQLNMHMRNLFIINGEESLTETERENRNTLISNIARVLDLIYGYEHE